MMKLIELLNEYDENRKIGKNGLYKWEEYDPNEEYVISKKFGFIKWLVENDKIDRDKVEKEKADYYFIEMFDNDEIMLMLLSISDTPIDDLISYLK